MKVHQTIFKIELVGWLANLRAPWGLVDGSS